MREVPPSEKIDSSKKQALIEQDWQQYQGWRQKK